MQALRVGPTLTVPASAMEVSFSRSSGPGGQHVQRTDTRVRLRIRLRECPGLRPGAIARLRARHPSLLTAEDELVLSGDEYRSQKRNIDAVRARATALLLAALTPPRRRRPTRPSRASRERRLEAKRQRAQTKRDRQRPE